MQARAWDAPAIHAAAVGLAALAMAWNSRENGFVWDDRAAIVGNSDVDASRSRWWELFRHDFWGFAINTKTSHKSYRPLTVLTFRWDRSWHGLDPRGFHLTNVVVHAICAVLVWRTAWVVLNNKTGQYLSALLAGLLFAVHPIHCDAVASIVGRADLLCTVFSLGGFLVFDIAERSRSWSCVATACFLGACACLCKELGITVFGLYVAHDVTRSLASIHGSADLSRTRVLRLACVVISALCLLAMRLWVNGEQTKAFFNVLANSISNEESQLTRLLSYAHVHSWYLWKLVWPSWLSYDYGFNTIPVITKLADTRNFLTALAYATVIAGVVKAVRDIRTSPLLMCIAFGVIPFVPASNIFFPVGTIVAERLLYFPSVGFCLLVGYMAERFAESLRRLEGPTSPRSSTRETTRPLGLHSVRTVVRPVATALVGFILLASTSKSISRNKEWKSEEALFASAVEVVPDNVKALNNAAKVFLNTDPARALQLARTAIALLPRHVEGQSNLGLAHSSTPKILLAVRHMAKAFAFSSVEVSGPGYTGSHIYNYWIEQHNSSASTERMMQSSTVKLALKFIDTAIERGSRVPVHFYQRGIISERLYDLSTASRHMELAKIANARAARRGLDSEMILNGGALHNQAALLRAELGQKDEALAELLAGVELYPGEASLYFNAASILIAREQLRPAAELLDRCLRRCEGADMIEQGARLLDHHGQHDAARRFREQAARLRMASV